MPIMTIDFMDGSREIFDVPPPPDHATTRRARLDMFLEGRFLTVEDGSIENGVIFYPMENIKSIRVEGSSPGLELPPPSVRGARRVTEDNKPKQSPTIK